MGYGVSFACASQFDALLRTYCLIYAAFLRDHYNSHNGTDWLVVMARFKFPWQLDDKKKEKSKK